MIWGNRLILSGLGFYKFSLWINNTEIDMEVEVYVYEMLQSGLPKSLVLWRNSSFQKTVNDNVK